LNSNKDISTVRLTEYSHGAGCGCKISPKLLNEMLGQDHDQIIDPSLIVGSESRDDAAVYDLGDGNGLISTTDFFMPIVDDPYTFGMISGCNALSDIYAMGGKPLMAIAIFGWPIDKLPAEIGAKVIEGGRAICKTAGISLAGGHSIDSPEPIFGLSVSGIVKMEHLKRNTGAQIGDSIFLTKPLGVGILSTAQKQKKVTPKDYQEAVEQMCQLNDIGSKIAKIKGVNAITDVTGFGLAGHLLEVCQGSNVGAKVCFNDLPLLSNIHNYIDKGCVSGGTKRNYDSYGHFLNKLSILQNTILCDPQTSGGLLITVSDESLSDFHELLNSQQANLRSIGKIIEPNSKKEVVYIE